MKKRFKVMRILSTEEHGYVEAPDYKNAVKMAEDPNNTDIEWLSGKISDVEFRMAWEVDKLGRRVDK